MRLRLNDQAVLCVEFMVEQHPEKHSICPFLCQRYAITGALQLFTTFLQLLQRKGRHKRTRDEWKKFHESRIVRALKPYRAAWGRMKGAKFCSPRCARNLTKIRGNPCVSDSPHELNIRPWMYQKPECSDGFLRGLSEKAKIPNGAWRIFASSTSSRKL